MRDHELDRILSGEDELVPSSGFVRNVMEGLRMEASAPAAIPFPWMRVLPGLVACILFLVTMCVTSLSRSGPRRLPEAPASSTFMSDLGEYLRAANAGGFLWILLALILTYASVKLSLRLTQSKG